MATKLQLARCEAERNILRAMQEFYRLDLFIKLGREPTESEIFKATFEISPPALDPGGKKD